MFFLSRFFAFGLMKHWHYKNSFNILITKLTTLIKILPGATGVVVAVKSTGVAAGAELQVIAEVDRLSPLLDCCCWSANKDEDEETLCCNNSAGITPELVECNVLWGDRGPYINIILLIET